jgi:hypothetical protein
MANKLMVTTLIVLCRVDTDSKLVWFGEDRGVKRTSQRSVSHYDTRRCQHVY